MHSTGNAIKFDIRNRCDICSLCSQFFCQSGFYQRYSTSNLFCLISGYHGSALATMYCSRTSFPTLRSSSACPLLWHSSITTYSSFKSSDAPDAFISTFIKAMELMMIFSDEGCYTLKHCRR